MDIDQAIRALLEEKKRLDHLIAVLEELEPTPNKTQIRRGKKRRGRKSMSLEERRQVSERMKRYWAQRRGRSQLEGEQSAAEPLHPRRTTG